MGFVGGTATASFAQELTNVRIALPWFRNGQYSALMAADSNGYFKDEGLKIEMIDGGPGKNSVLTVGTGQAEFGITFTPSVATARAAEPPVDVVAIGVIMQRSPYGWITLVDPGAPDPKPEDMIGKRVGIQSDGEMFLGAVAKKYDLDMSKIGITTIQGGAEPLLTGQVDYASGWINDVPYLIETETAKPDAPESIRGKTWKAIMLNKVALPNYNNAVITTGAIIKDNPEMVRKFMKALARGMEFMAGHPDETAKIAVAYPGQIDDAAKINWRMSIDNGLQQSEKTKENGFLWMEPEVWQGMMEFYVNAGRLSKVVPTSEVMTNEFNPKIQSK